jgi:hypothetical protein
MEPSWLATRNRHGDGRRFHGELAQFGGEGGPKSGPVAYTDETHSTATDFKRVPLEILSQAPVVQTDPRRLGAKHVH